MPSSAMLPHRCSKCEARYTWRLRWDRYYKRKRCLCGSYQFRVDKWMLWRRRNVKPCCCSGYHFPHRAGSKWCQSYTGKLTKRDLKQRNMM